MARIRPCGVGGAKICTGSRRETLKGSEGNALFGCSKSTSLLRCQDSNAAAEIDSDHLGWILIRNHQEIAEFEA
jgi:hypothetical protein